MKVGKRLRELRNSLKLTQKELAQKIKGKIDYTYIGKIERGNQYPSLRTLEKISDTLNIDMECFFSSRPIEYYINKEANLNKIDYISDICTNLAETDLNFLIEIIKLINKYNKLKESKTYRVEEGQKILKAADKKGKYKEKI